LYADSLPEPAPSTVTALLSDAMVSCTGQGRADNHTDGVFDGALLCINLLPCDARSRRREREHHRVFYWTGKRGPQAYYYGL
jgi:hypothetical protein